MKIKLGTQMECRRGLVSFNNKHLRTTVYQDLYARDINK